jgi:uncharacterized protein (DUF1501 family)
MNCQSVLMARRLVEAGVSCVCVHWYLPQVKGQAAFMWDTHSHNFEQLKNALLPPFDACFSALLEDLELRGLLENTLVFVFGEMGRTPKVGDRRTGGKLPAGRDHWGHCHTVLFAGGGIRGGQVYGSSDRIAAYPADRPVVPEHLAATIYQAMGISPEELVIKDKLGRPLSLLEDGAGALPLF